jgi:hypothetical protein
VLDHRAVAALGLGDDLVREVHGVETSTISPLHRLATPTCGTGSVTTKARTTTSSARTAGEELVAATW